MAQLTPEFFAKILKIEGGFQDDPTDNGNYCGGVLIGTKYGMSAGAVGTWLGRCPSKAEMIGLKESDAFAFYSWYFDLYNIFKVENQIFAELLANNTMGSPSNAAKIEQRVLNTYGYNLAVDGDRGAQTIAALNEAYKKHGAALYNKIRYEWIEYLKRINKPQFLPGWLKRMELFPELSTTANTGIMAGISILFIMYLISKNEK